MYVLEVNITDKNQPVYIEYKLVTFRTMQTVFEECIGVLHVTYLFVVRICSGLLLPVLKQPKACRGLHVIRTDKHIYRLGNVYSLSPHPLHARSLSLVLEALEGSETTFLNVS